MHRCNGNGNCYRCNSTHCFEWTECDICKEYISDDDYYHVDCKDYHIKCFEEKYKIHIEL